MRIKISRKEAKESGYWVELTEPKEEQMMEKQNLIKEPTELHEDIRFNCREVKIII